MCVCCDLASINWTMQIQLHCLVSISRVCYISNIFPSIYYLQRIVAFTNQNRIIWLTAPTFQSLQLIVQVPFTTFLKRMKEFCTLRWGSEIIITMLHLIYNGFNNKLTHVFSAPHSPPLNDRQPPTLNIKGTIYLGFISVIFPVELHCCSMLAPFLMVSKCVLVTTAPCSPLDNNHYERISCRI